MSGVRGGGFKMRQGDKLKTSKGPRVVGPLRINRRSKELERWVEEAWNLTSDIIWTREGPRLAKKSGK